MENAVVIVIIVALLVGSGRFGALIRVLSRRYQLPFLEVVSGREIPISFRPFFQKSARPVQQMGFKHLGFVSESCDEVAPNCIIHTAVFHHPEHKSFALLHQSVEPQQEEPLVLRFISCYSDDTQVETDNQHALIRLFSRHLVHGKSLSSDSAEQLWHMHQDETAYFESLKTKRDLLELNLQGFVEFYNHGWREDFVSALQNGEVKGEEGGFLLAVKTAYRYLNCFLKRARARAVHLNKVNTSFNQAEGDFSQLLATDDLLGPQTHVVKILRTIERQPSARPAVGWASFAISLLVFSLFFGFWIAWDFVPILISVLLLHELGHFVAMRLFNYQQTSIFFVPGLGAAATGRAGNAGYWQRFLVYLAGPLPGISLAFLLWVLIPEQPQWLLTTSIALLIINWLNLLPFMPLDGGQIVGLNLGERGRMLFSWVSAVGLFLLAWSLSEPVLWVIGAWAVFSAISRQSQLGLRSCLKQELKESDTEEEFAERALKILQAPAYAGINFSSRVQLLNEFIEELHMPVAKIRTRTLGILFYLISLTMPVWLAILLVFTSSTESLNIEPERDWYAEIQQAEGPGRAVSVALEATQYSLEYYDYAGAREYLEEAQRRSVDQATTDNQRQALSGYDLRLWILQSNADLDLQLVASHLSEYLNVATERNQDWYDVLNEAYTYLPDDGNLTQIQVVELMATYLQDQGQYSELAFLYSMMPAQRMRGDRGVIEEISWLEKAVATAPDEERATYQEQLADAHMVRGEFNRAYAIYSALEEGQHGDEEFAYTRMSYAWAAYNVGEYAQAMVLYENHIQDRLDGYSENLITYFLVGKDIKLQVEFDVRLYQLVVADSWGNSAEIHRIREHLQKLTEKHDLASTIRSQLTNSGEHVSGVYLEQISLRLKVLDRYFPASG